MANSSNPTIAGGCRKDYITATTSEACIAGRGAKITTTSAGARTCAMADAYERPLGVFAEDSASGAVANIIPNAGEFPLEVDGSGTAIAAGDPIKMTANGQGVKAEYMTGPIVGYALDPATANGAVIGVSAAPAPGFWYVGADAVANGQTSKATTITGLAAATHKAIVVPIEVATNSISIRAVVITADTLTVTVSGDPGASGLDYDIFIVKK